MASAEIVGSFLAKLGMLCTSNMSGDEALERVEQYIPMLCSEYDNELFLNAECLATVAKRCKFFPGYGELCGHLSEFVRLNMPMRLALPAPTIPDRVPPTQAELDHAAAAVREATANMQRPFRPESEDARPIKAAPLSDGNLLAAWKALEAAGNPFAPMRIAALKERMEQRI